MSFSSLEAICKRMKIELPKETKILPQYWSVKKAGRLGALRRIELYGNPGTPEGGRKGGLNTQKKFRSDPNFAKRIGFIQRKKIKYPKESPALAEFIGIMLGDGGVRDDYQITVSFNPKHNFVKNGIHTDLRLKNFVLGYTQILCNRLSYLTLHLCASKKPWV